MKKFFSILMAVMLAARGLGADAANDLILSQRKADNSGSIQRNVAPTARGFFTFDGSKIPASTTDLTYTTPTFSVPDAFNISSAGSVTITGGGSNKSINLLPSGTGTVGIGLVNSSSGARVGILDANASTSPDLNSWTNGGNQITTFSEATSGILLNVAGSSNVRPTIALKKARGTLAVPTAVADGDQLGQLIFQGYDGNAFGFYGGNIASKVDGTVSTAVIPTRLDFSLSTLAGSNLLALTLRSDGSATFSAAQPPSVSTATGTAVGNTFTVNGSTGGNTTIATTGTGGTGGAVFYGTGNGGTAASAVTASTGGAGGLWRIAAGTGGASAVSGSGTGTGGKGGGVQIVTGNGGAVSTSTGVNLGGAGGDWTQTSGSGGNASAGSSNTGGAGGAVNITTGNGGTGATAAGNSGTMTLKTGTSGTGGTVGSIILQAGGVTGYTLGALNQSTFTPTAPASVATSPGTSAGNVFVVTGAIGGASSIATTGTGGIGGALSLTAGAGGTAASATTASTGGAGGGVTLSSGAGGASAVAGSGTGTGGNAGTFAESTGVGGAASTSTGVNIGGTGGSWTFTTGNGGAATNGSSNTGGAAGNITLTTGNGGAGATAAGNSGTLNLVTGTAGSGGTVGNIIFKVGNVQTLAVSGGAAATLTGGAGNMTITAGTGASHTLTFQTTTSGSSAATFLSGDASQNTTISKLISSYNGISTAGNGVVAIVKATRVTAQSAANSSICTYTTPASDGSYEVSANMNVTASTTLSTTLTCTYTDESNTARSLILPVTGLTGSFVALGAISGAGTSVWETPVMHIRCKASTAITILTSAGTFSGVTYTAEGIIKQTQ